MRKILTALATAATVASGAMIATPASAQPYGYHNGHGYRGDYRHARYDHGHHRGWERARWERERAWRHHRERGWHDHHRGYYGRHW